ncbi:unnamed protein product [Prorocentrum cordatum]|uniref:RNA-directed RNA polymerase n=1 Tax=Prorocentrum cordatum TaxID=2364126 RepID=A0ABN9PFT4_9DINO|nr:unnamed protein product [Polarella glacialis]
MAAVAIPGGAAALPAWAAAACAACPELAVCAACPACEPPPFAACPACEPPPCAACPACEARACPEPTAGEKAVERLVGALLGGLVHWLALPGERVVCRLADEDVDHELVLTHYPGSGQWFVLTPGVDIYAEDLSCSDPESRPSRALPLALRARRMRRLYRLRERLGPDELGDARQRGRETALERDATLPEPREASAADGQQVIWQEAAGRLSAGRRARSLRLGSAMGQMGGRRLEAPRAGQAWIALSGGPGIAIGTEVDVANTDGVSFEDGVVPFGVLNNARTLWVDYDEQGEWFRRWTVVVGESCQVCHPDVKVDGPPGALHMSKHVERRGGDPRLWLDVVVRAKRLGQGDCETIVEALCQCGVYDQLDMGGLMMVEVMTRRVVAVVDAYAGPFKPSGTIARFVEGASSEEDVSGPKLRGYVHRRVKGRHEMEQVQNWARFLPLPLLGDAGRRIRSRSCRARHFGRGARILSEVNGIVDAINWMSGYDSQPGPANGMQRDVLARFEGLVRGRQPDAKLHEPQAALRELLRGRSPYDGRIGPTTVASYSAGLVSMPTDVRDCPRLEDLLPGEALAFLQERQERMLRPAPLPTDIEPYFDSVLKFNRKEYRGLVRRLLSAGMLGIEVHLPEEGLSNYEDLRVALEAQQVYIGMADMKDCFHRVRIDAALSRSFCLPPVKAGAFGVSEVEGAEVQASTAIYPCWQGLPMGFSWSLYFALRANEEVSRRGSPLLREPGLSDHGPPLVFAPGRAPPEIRHCVYVDDLGVFSLFSQLVSGVVDQLTGEFTELNLLLRKDELVSGMAVALGAEINGGRLRARVTGDRFWRCRQAVRGLPARRRVKGWAVEAVMGHLTFCGLCSRGTLSAFDSVHGFARARYDDAAVLWAEARRGLAAFSSLMYFLESDWWLPWNPMAQQSDASHHGYGLARAFWPRELVESAALCAAGFGMSESGKWGLRGLPDDEEELSQWDVVGDFPEHRACVAAALGALTGAGGQPGGVARPAASPCSADRATAVAGGSAGASAERVEALEGGRVGPSSSTEPGDLARLPVPAEPARGVPESVGSSDSGSSEPEVVTGAARRRRLAQSQPRRARHYGMPASEEGLSLLEREAVRAPTQREYQQAWDGWRDFARLSWPLVVVEKVVKGWGDPVVDPALVTYLSGLYQAGAHLSWAEKLMAGELRFNPDFSGYGARRLPRAWRCLRAWRRPGPPRTRQPWALAMWCAMAWRMQAWGSLQMAVFTSVAGGVCGRPSSLLLLKPTYLVPPAVGACEFWTLRLFPKEEDRRGKTGLGDEALELDLPWIRFLDPVLHRPEKEGRPECLWNFMYPEYWQRFSLRLQGLQVKAKVVPHQMRHSGASLDMARRWRRLADGQTRGQWKTTRSVALFENHARLATTRATLSSAPQSVFLVYEAQLADIILGRASPVDSRELGPA